MNLVVLYINYDYGLATNPAFCYEVSTKPHDRAMVIVDVDLVTNDVVDRLIELLSMNEPGFVRRYRLEWRCIEPGVTVMYPENRPNGRSCDFVPRSFVQYLRQKIAFELAEESEIQRLDELHDLYNQLEYPPWFVPPAFSGLQFGEHPNVYYTSKLRRWVPFNIDLHAPNNNASHPDHPCRSAVLSELTIWSRYTPPYCFPYRSYVDWPCHNELAWEGDQRVASENGRFGRYFPLPRKSNYEGNIHWSAREYVVPWPMDNIWPVPQMDDIYLPVEQIQDSMVPVLLHHELLQALDA